MKVLHTFIYKATPIPKRKLPPQNYEEEKIHDEEIVSVRKLKKSQTE